MVIKNIYIRLLAGGSSILLGVALLKVHLDRHKETLWGRIYRLGRELGIAKQEPPITDKIYLIIGCFALICGLIILIFGLRSTLVGK